MMDYCVRESTPVEESCFDNRVTVAGALQEMNKILCETEAMLAEMEMILTGKVEKDDTATAKPECVIEDVKNLMRSACRCMEKVRRIKGVLI